MEKMTIKEQADIISEKWQSIDTLSGEYAKSAGLTYMSLIILEIIYAASEDCTQKRICELTHLPKQSVNVIIKSFLDQGYAEMKEISSDRRNKRVWLTEKGRHYADKIIGTKWKAELYAIEQFTDEERLLLVELLGRYEKCFREHIGESRKQILPNANSPAK